MAIKYISIPELLEKDIMRFWSKVNILDNDQCWKWQGYSRNKYGGIKINKKFYSAHRVAYYLYYKKDPVGFIVMHSCDNYICCNPLHLSLGTTQDNSNDMVKKGRSLVGDKNPSRTQPEKLARGLQNGKYTKPEKTPKGSKHGNAKFTEEQILEIRRLYIEENLSQSKLAKMFNAGKTTVSHIVHRRYWTHI